MMERNHSIIHVKITEFFQLFSNSITLDFLAEKFFRPLNEISQLYDHVAIKIRIFF